MLRQDLVMASPAAYYAISRIQFARSRQLTGGHSLWTGGQLKMPEGLSLNWKTARPIYTIFMPIHTYLWLLLIIPFRI